MNAHEIGQLEVEGEANWLLAQTKPVGCALEPTLVQLNHSCDPTLLRLDFFKNGKQNFSRMNIGTATLCFASRDLAAGEEVLSLKQTLPIYQLLGDGLIQPSI